AAKSSCTRRASSSRPNRLEAVRSHREGPRSRALSSSFERLKLAGGGLHARWCTRRRRARRQTACRGRLAVASEPRLPALAVGVCQGRLKSGPPAPVEKCPTGVLLRTAFRGASRRRAERNAVCAPRRGQG